MVKHKRFVYSIREVFESGEQILVCTGVAITDFTILTAAYCMEKYEPTDNYTKLRVSNEQYSHGILTSESHMDYGSGFSEVADICIVTVIFL